MPTSPIAAEANATAAVSSFSCHYRSGARSRRVDRCGNKWHGRGIGYITMGRANETQEEPVRTSSRFGEQPRANTVVGRGDWRLADG